MAPITFPEPLPLPDYSDHRSTTRYDARVEDVLGGRYAGERVYNEGTDRRLAFFETDHRVREKPLFFQSYTQEVLRQLRQSNRRGPQGQSFSAMPEDQVLQQMGHVRRDDVEHFWLKQRFGAVSPTYVNRYLKGRDLEGRIMDNVWLHYVYFQPEDPRGLVVDFPGFNRSFYHHPERAEELLRRGYAYLSMDRLGEGDSAPWNPARPETGDARIHTMQAVQFLYEARRLRHDFNLEGTPLYAIGTELGGLTLIDAMMTDPDHGIERAFIDDPLFAVGPRNTIGRLVYADPSPLPEDWRERPFDIYFQTPHPHIIGRSPTRQQHIRAYYQGQLGTPHIPLPYLATIGTHARAVAERFHSGVGTLPPLMLGYAPMIDVGGFEIVRGDVNLDLWLHRGQQLEESGIQTFVRPTVGHDGLDQVHDPEVYNDVDTFFRGETPSDHPRIQGREAYTHFAQVREVRGVREIQGSHNPSRLREVDREMRDSFFRDSIRRGI